MQPRSIYSYIIQFEIRRRTSLTWNGLIFQCNEERNLEIGPQESYPSGERYLQADLHDSQLKASPCYYIYHIESIVCTFWWMEFLLSSRHSTLKTILLVAFGVKVAKLEHTLAHNRTILQFRNICKAPGYFATCEFTIIPNQLYTVVLSLDPQHRFD